MMQKSCIYGGGVTHLHVNNNQIIIQPYILNDDDMFILPLQYVSNMYIAFVTPAVDVRDRDQV